MIVPYRSHMWHQGKLEFERQGGKERLGCFLTDDLVNVEQCRIRNMDTGERMHVALG